MKRKLSVILFAVAMAMTACQGAKTATKPNTVASETTGEERTSVKTEGIKDAKVTDYAVHEISDPLKDNIACIKNLETECSEGRTTAIILDKKGSVYLKTLEDIVSLEGTTTLKDIAYAVESPYEYGDFIIYDDSGMYYISAENKTIREYELSKDISKIVKFNEEFRMWGIDKSGNGVMGTKEDTWNFKPSLDAKNVSFAGGGALLIGEKLYSDSIMLGENGFEQEAQNENKLLMDQVKQVWAWDNLKLETCLMVSTNDSQLYLINPFLSYKEYKLDLDETVENVYFVSGESYADAVVVTTNNVYLVAPGYNDVMDTIYNLEPVEGMSSYLDSVKGFYCEEHMLFALMEDGNIYMVKDFLDPETRKLASE